MEKSINEGLIVYAMTEHLNTTFNMSIYDSDATIMMWNKDGIRKKVEDLGFHMESGDIEGQAVMTNRKDYPRTSVIICKK